jgi:hypothetical protein
MTRLILLLALVAIGYWLYKEFTVARRKAYLANRDARGYPVLPPHQRVSSADLEARLQTLREALGRGELTLDEAADSLVRYAGGMDTVRAKELLTGP